MFVTGNYTLTEGNTCKNMTGDFCSLLLYMPSAGSVEANLCGWRDHRPQGRYLSSVNSLRKNLNHHLFVETLELLIPNLRDKHVYWYQSQQQSITSLELCRYYLILVGCLYFVSFLAIMAIPLTLWHSHFVKSFLSLLSKKQNFHFLKKCLFLVDIAFSVLLLTCLYVCIFSIVATPFNLQL